MPKNFAQAKKAACMNSRKSKWCTAANKSFFKNYSSQGQLYVIRNQSKDIMFQMNFKKSGGLNFKNEADRTAKVEEFTKHNPPKELLKSIKSEDGNTLDELINPKEEEVKKTIINTPFGEIKKEETTDSKSSSSIEGRGRKGKITRYEINGIKIKQGEYGMPEIPNRDDYKELFKYVIKNYKGDIPKVYGVQMKPMPTDEKTLDEIKYSVDKILMDTILKGEIPLVYEEGDIKALLYKDGNGGYIARIEGKTYHNLSRYFETREKAKKFDDVQPASLEDFLLIARNYRNIKNMFKTKNGKYVIVPNSEDRGTGAVYDVSKPGKAIEKKPEMAMQLINKGEIPKRFTKELFALNKDKGEEENDTTIKTKKTEEEKDFASKAIYERGVPSLGRLANLFSFNKGTGGNPLERIKENLEGRNRDKTLAVIKRPRTTRVYAIYKDGKYYYYREISGEYRSPMPFKPSDSEAMTILDFIKTKDAKLSKEIIETHQIKESLKEEILRYSLL